MSTSLNQKFCFCTLAFKAKYRILAKELAKNLQQYSPGTTLVVGTDRTKDFRDCTNVFAFKLKQKGIIHCYNDKRFVIQEALKNFPTVIQIDADTKITNNLPKEITHSVGISALHVEKIWKHAQEYNPERLIHIQKLANKLDLCLENVSYVGESLFAITADKNKSLEFINYWDYIARYLELHGIHSGEGNAIGLAAAKAGLTIYHPSWLENINSVRKHLDVSEDEVPQNQWQILQKRFTYHYRLNKARIAALKNFDLFYK